MGGDVGRKPSLSDTSAIYISSGSDDEGGARLGVDHGEGEVNEHQEEHTDQDVDTWADTAMILSVPPSPTPPASSDLVSAVPTAEVALPNPARTSKFRPAPAAASVTDVRAPASHRKSSTSYRDATSDEDTIARRLVCRAPLLVARAKGRDDDIIDLTSD